MLIGFNDISMNSFIIFIAVTGLCAKDPVSCYFLNEIRDLWFPGKLLKGRCCFIFRAFLLYHCCPPVFKRLWRFCNHRGFFPLFFHKAYLGNQFNFVKPVLYRLGHLAVKFLSFHQPDFHFGRVYVHIQHSRLHGKM